MTTTTTEEGTWLTWLTSDRRLPLWQRIVVMAYAKAGADDVLWLEPGELARVTRVPDRRMLTKAIDRAVELGYLTEPSGTTALRLAPVGERDE